MLILHGTDQPSDSVLHICVSNSKGILVFSLLTLLGKGSNAENQIKRFTWFQPVAEMIRGFAVTGRGGVLER